MGLFIIFVFFASLTLFIVGVSYTGRNTYPKLYVSKLGRRLNKKRDYVHQTLNKYFNYYKHLNGPEKDLFLSRVAYFAGTTKFIPHKGFELTEVHIVMISASFVQLTFGLKKSYLRHFNEFHIYPQHFMNYQTRNYHKGEINMKGSLSLSWEDYLEGQKDPHDGLNVGLHELAHAFSMEITHSGMGYRHLVMKLQPIYYRARREINDSRYRLLEFRGYAYTNMHEYFAVATEVFFEQPKLMRDKHPNLYAEMCALYKQDPASGIFKLNKGKPIL